MLVEEKDRQKFELEQVYTPSSFLNLSRDLPKNNSNLNSSNNPENLNSLKEERRLRNSLPKGKNSRRKMN